MAEDGENVFSTDPVEQTVDLTLNDLVGEGRKYKDPDDLAKAYANIEKHAKTLEAERAADRARIDQLEATTKNPAHPQTTGQGQPPQADPPVPTPPKAPSSGDQTDFRSQIRDEVKSLNEQERAKANTEAAALKMIEAYGDAGKANEAVQRRARELDVSVDWLRDSASRSPEAFYATMGIAASGRSQSTPASTPGARLENNRDVKNFEHFDRLRKENPKLYFTPATQREMMNNARTMGDDFYKR